MVGKLFPLAPNVALGTWNNNQGAKVSPICFSVRTGVTSIGLS